MRSRPTRFGSRSAMNGWRYSEWAWAMWAMTWRILRAYGRAALRRSRARRILLAATISIARVIF